MLEASFEGDVGIASVAVATVLFGIPAATICQLRRRLAELSRVLTAWILAAAPVAVAVMPLL